MFNISDTFLFLLEAFLYEDVVMTPLTQTQRKPDM